MASHHEGRPLEARSVDADTVSQAIESDKEREGADQADWQWAVEKPDEASQILDGDGAYYFPKTGMGNVVHYVQRNQKDPRLFNRGFARKDSKWQPGSRVVYKKPPVETTPE